MEILPAKFDCTGFPHAEDVELLEGPVLVHKARNFELLFGFLFDPAGFHKAYFIMQRYSNLMPGPICSSSADALRLDSLLGLMVDFRQWDRKY